MKCPRCGNDMIIDNHRKIPLEMCYDCGYIEGRNMPTDKNEVTNFEHSKTLNINELASFIAEGLALDGEKVFIWLEKEFHT